MSSLQAKGADEALAEPAIHHALRSAQASSIMFRQDLFFNERLRNYSRLCEPIALVGARPFKNLAASGPGFRPTGIGTIAGSQTLIRLNFFTSYPH